MRSRVDRVRLSGDIRNLLAEVFIIQNFVLFEENEKQHCVRTNPSQIRCKTLPQAEEAFLSNGCSQYVLLNNKTIIVGGGEEEGKLTIAPEYSGTPFIVLMFCTLREGA